MSQTLFQELMLAAPLPLTLHPARVYLSSLSPGSQSTMKQSLNAIANLLTNNQCDLDTLNWASLRYQHTAAVQAVLVKKHAPATAKKMMCGLKRVLKEARKLGLIDADTYANAVDLPSIKSSKKLRGRALTQSEITKLINACQSDPTPQGVRDAALIAILRGGGLRRAEVVKLRLKDFKPRDGALDISDGKGGKDRTIYLPENAIALVENWLNLRTKQPGALLCPIRKGGKIELRKMTPQAVLLICAKRAKQTGVDSFSPHDFRRTFCSDLLDAGVDISTVQKLAGHSNPSQTSKYDRRGEETKRKAVQCLGF